MVWGKTCSALFFFNKKWGWTLEQMDVVRQGWWRKLWKWLRRTALWWSVWYGCPGRFVPKFCHVENHEAFPGHEEIIRKGIGISWKTLKFGNLVEKMENWFFQEDWDLKMKGFREGEVGKSLDKGMWKYFPWTHETHHQHPSCSDVQADVLADLDVLCSLARVALTAFGSPRWNQLKQLWMLTFEHGQGGNFFLLDTDSLHIFCWVFLGTHESL